MVLARKKDTSRYERFLAAFMGCWCSLIIDKEPNEFMLNGYFESLKGFTIEQIEIAFSRAIKECKFFPKPIEVIELIQGPASSIEDQAMIQATTVLNTVKRIGAGQSVKFDDPVITATIKQGFGGWIKLCSELLSSQEQWFIKDFIRIYSSYKRQNIGIDGHCIGIIEQENFNNGYPGDIPEPAVIESLGKTSVKQIENQEA